MRLSLRLLQALTIISVFHLSSVTAESTEFQSEPIELLIDFRLEGHFSSLTEEGLPIYTLEGPGYAPLAILPSAEVTDIIIPQHKITDLVGAQITFEGEFDDPIIRFTCLQGSCNINIAGSVFTSHAGLKLEGRAANIWGPVIHSPNYDPENGIYPIRIMGCGGLTETSGHGRYAGMVGAICFNGVLNFNKYNSGVLSGSSKCTIALHTPASLVPPKGLSSN